MNFEKSFENRKEKVYTISQRDVIGICAEVIQWIHPENRGQEIIRMSLPNALQLAEEVTEINNEIDNINENDDDYKEKMFDIFKRAKKAKKELQELKQVYKVEQMKIKI